MVTEKKSMIGKYQGEGQEGTKKGWETGITRLQGICDGYFHFIALW